jgi:hypothetical protein
MGNSRPIVCATQLFAFYAQNFHFNIHSKNNVEHYNYLPAIQFEEMVPDDTVRFALLLFNGFNFDPKITKESFEDGMQQIFVSSNKDSSSGVRGCFCGNRPMVALRLFPNFQIQAFLFDGGKI